MLTRIGKPTAPADAVGLLLECHERIRTFLALARRLAEARGEDPEEVREAASRVRRYFAEALPLHADDEERSILPRLRGRDPAVDAELEAMHREHAEHARPLRELIEACEAIALGPERHAGLAPSIGAAAGELERHFAAHLRREEEVIFPAMRRLLDAAADAEIVKEIRARRSPEDPLQAPRAAGPIVKYLEADHLVLDALLSGALHRPGEIDRQAYDDFREALLRHMAIEEKILLPAARDARGEPLPEARQVRIEHGALAALLAGTPSPELAAEIREILGPHNALEEDCGVYEVCESLLADHSGEILRRIREYPPVKAAPYRDGPGVPRTAEDAMRLASRQFDRRS